jgi:hypothetical protein
MIYYIINFFIKYSIFLKTYLNKWSNTQKEFLKSKKKSQNRRKSPKKSQKRRKSSKKASAKKISKKKKSF